MPLSVQLIGLGRIAWLLEKDPYRYHPCTHAGTLRYLLENRRRPGFEVSGACDHNPERLQAFQQWWRAPLEKCSLDYRELLSEPADLVVIAPNLDAHYEIASAAIKSGARALLIEKPITETLSQSKKLSALARKNRTRIWINFERRYHPGYRLVKKIIEEERYGPLRSIQGQVLTGAPHPHLSLAGPLLHDAIHWIDLLLWYAGVPQKMNSRMLAASTKKVASQSRIEDTTYLNFEYPEFHVFLESGGRRRYFEFEMQLDFAEGRVVSGNRGHFFYKARPSRRYKNFRDLAPDRIKVPVGNAWVKLYQEIFKELAASVPKNSVEYNRAQDRITAGFPDALAGMEIIERAYRSFPLNGQ